MSLRDGEWEAVVNRFPLASIVWRDDQTGLVHLPALVLPRGWTGTTTSVWFVVPVGYPGALLDCFWAEPQLRLAGDRMPKNTGLQPVGGDGQPGLWFSWHLQSWKPEVDGLSSFIRSIEARLRDAT